MMKLRTSPGSPYGRKAALAIHLLGLESRFQFVDADQDVGDRIRKLNPLNKVPILVLEDDSVIFDSPVIVEYIDAVAGGGKIIPTEVKARFRALTLQALADGMMDSCGFVAYESRWHTPEQCSATWIAHQQAKIEKAADELEKAPPSGPVDVGQIALICAMDYMDKRNEGKWRNGRPKLVAWRDAFVKDVAAYSKLPAF